jgi:predicted dienelactone hydrolase
VAGRAVAPAPRPLPSRAARQRPRASWGVFAAIAVGAALARPAWADAGLAERLAQPGVHTVETLDLDLPDPARGRTLPLRLRVPQPCTAAQLRPLVVFSHGLGGSRAGGAAWGAHWASHGFVVAHLQHPGSDESLWRGQPGGFTLEALRPGMTPVQYVARVRDVPFALDALAALAASPVVARPGLGCIDMARVGMSGHSFGALTTQALAGQSLPRLAEGGAAPWGRDPRVVAAIAFSPSMRDGSPAARASFATVAVPFLAVTGSLDGDVVGSGATAASRRAVHEALPGPGRRLLWLDGADHMGFDGGAPRPPADGRADDRGMQRVVRAVTLAFWQATLAGDTVAQAWLDGGGPDTLLGPGDRWVPR